MGNLAVSPLPGVSNLALELTIFPLFFVLWWQKRKSIVGVFFVLPILAYHLIVRIGGNIQNPITDYIGQDADDANFILNVIFCALAVFFSIVATTWSLYLDRVELLPIGNRMMAALYRSKKPQVSYIHFFVTILAMLCSFVGQILYTHFMNTPGNELLAWLLGLLVPIPVFVAYGLYAYFWGDSLIFGGDENYIAENGIRNEKSMDLLKTRRDNILKAVLPIALFQFFGTLIMGGVRFTWDDVDIQWPVAIGVLAVLIFVLILMMIVMYVRRKQTKPTLDDSTCDDTGPYYARRI